MYYEIGRYIGDNLHQNVKFVGACLKFMFRNEKKIVYCIDIKQ